MLRGGTPARHVRSSSEGSCDYGEILATSTVPLQKSGAKHQSAGALDTMGRGGSGSHTPSSGYITPRTGAATPIQPSGKVIVRMSQPLPLSPASSWVSPTYPKQPSATSPHKAHNLSNRLFAGRGVVAHKASRDTSRRLPTFPRHATGREPRVPGRAVSTGRIAPRGIAYGHSSVSLASFSQSGIIAPGSILFFKTPPHPTPPPIHAADSFVLAILAVSPSGLSIPFWWYPPPWFIGVYLDQPTSVFRRFSVA